jgi:hypothetical protein
MATIRNDHVVFTSQNCEAPTPSTLKISIDAFEAYLER